MKSRKLFAGLLGAAMAISFAGCSSSGSSSSSTGSDTGNTEEKTDTAASSDKSGGALIVGTTQELSGVFSPLFYITAYDAWAIDLVYQSMYAYNADSELYCQLASEDPEVSEDGMTITYKLKEGQKFADGTDLNANDVKFTFTLMADPDYIGERNDGTFNFIEGWADYQEGDADEVSGITVIDDYTVEFKLGTPDISAASTIGTFSIMSDEQFPYTKGDLGQYKTDTSDPLGSGPYKLNSYDKSAGASFVKNENYAGEGEYAIERVMIKTIATATELASLQNGDINYLPNIIEGDIIGPATVDDNLAYNHYFRAAEGYIGFNCVDGPTADPAVRQAISYATDRAAFVDAYYAYPEGEAAEDVKDVKPGYVPTAFWSPVATDMGEYTTGAEELDGLVTYDYDLEKAKQVLEDAGWKVGSDGIREKDGQKLEIKFLMSEGNSVLEMLTPMISQSWKEIGIDLKQNTVDFNTLISTVGVSNDDVTGWSCFFMATSFTGLTNTSMNDLLGFQGTVEDPTYLGNNYVRIVDQDLNDYLKAGKETGEEDVSIENYKKAMVRESELAPYLAMYGNNLFDIYTKNVKDVKTGSVCSWSQALADAYIE